LEGDTEKSRGQLGRISCKKSFSRNRRIRLDVLAEVSEHMQ
jgi:hypothetical protein